MSKDAKHQKDRRSQKGKRFRSILVLCISLVLLIGLAGWLFYQSKLGLLNYDDGFHEIDTTTQLPLDGLDIPELGNAPGDADFLKGLPSDGIFHDKDVVNILLLGTDDHGKTFSDNARADAIMLLSLNTKNHTIKLVSIERGIGVSVPGRNDDWITHTFRYGGAALTMQTVRDCFNVDVDRYIRVNFQSFQSGIDAIGGIDINITKAEADYMNDPSSDSRYGHGIQTVTPGLNHVNGATALNYARVRKIDSDWKRIQRQRNVIQAALDQVKNADLLTLNKLANTILPMIQTNLTKSEITSLLLEVPGFISGGLQIEQLTLPTEETCWNTVGVDGRKMIGVDFPANAKILHEFFYE